ncbi:MAG: hypothetical protein RIF41_32175 [Polyangiaceae bacterium]
MPTFAFAKPRLSLVIAPLAVALLTGCTTSPTTRPAASTHRASTYATSTAPKRAELPPGAMEFSFNDSRVRSFAGEAPRTRLLPGRTQRPRHLLVH